MLNAVWIEDYNIHTYFVHKAHTFFHGFVHIYCHAKGKFIQISSYLISILITDKKE